MSLFSLSSSLRLLLALVLILFLGWPCAGRWRCHDRDERPVAGYDRQPVTRALSGVIERGSMTAIVGANGCGKSTLLKTLAGFIPPVSGTFRWQGRRPVVGWLAQRHALEAQFPLTVQDVVSMGCWPAISVCRFSSGCPHAHCRRAGARGAGVHGVLHY